MRFQRNIRKLLWAFGYDISRYSPASHALARRKALMKSYGIDLVLDVGANIGQFGTETRRDMHYRGRIVSFEPLSDAFRDLKATALRDGNWHAFNYALGETAGKQAIHISGNSYSSSLLDMLPSHLNAAPESEYVGTETIEVKPLDDVLPKITSPKDRIWLKIDAQGFEGHVLRGAAKSLSRIQAIQLEMSLTPLYDGQDTFEDLLRLLKGYELVSLEPGFAEPTGRLLQVDGIFRLIDAAV